MSGVMPFPQSGHEVLMAVLYPAEVPGMAAPNNNFVNAIPLTDKHGARGGSTTSATSQTGEPNPTPPSVWYTFTPPTSETYILTVESPMGAVLHVYTGTAVDALTPVTITSTAVTTGVEKPGATTIAYQLDANAGTIYRLQVSGTSGLFTLRWQDLNSGWSEWLQSAPVGYELKYDGHTSSYSHGQVPHYTGAETGLNQRLYSNGGPFNQADIDLMWTSRIVPLPTETWSGDFANAPGFAMKAGVGLATFITARFSGGLEQVHGTVVTSGLCLYRFTLPDEDWKPATPDGTVSIGTNPDGTGSFQWKPGESTTSQSGHRIEVVPTVYTESDDHDMGPAITYSTSGGHPVSDTNYTHNVSSWTRAQVYLHDPDSPAFGGQQAVLDLDHPFPGIAGLTVPQLLTLDDNDLHLGEVYLQVTGQYDSDPTGPVGDYKPNSSTKTDVRVTIDNLDPYIKVDGGDRFVNILMVDNALSTTPPTDAFLTQMNKKWLLEADTTITLALRPPPYRYFTWEGSPDVPVHQAVAELTTVSTLTAEGIYGEKIVGDWVRDGRNFTQ